MHSMRFVDYNRFSHIHWIKYFLCPGRKSRGIWFLPSLCICPCVKGLRCNWFFPYILVTLCKSYFQSSTRLSVSETSLPKWPCAMCNIQWWFVKPDTFVTGQYFRINEFSGWLNCPLVRTEKSVPALFVREISGLSEPGSTNHHCTSCYSYCMLCACILRSIIDINENWSS